MLCKVVLPNGVQEVEYGTRIFFPIMRDLGVELCDTEDVRDCWEVAKSKNIVGANVDGLVTRLTHKVISNCRIEPFTSKNYFGQHMVMRSASCLLMAAVKQVAPEIRLEVGQSLHSQLFYEVHNCENIESLVQKLNNKFQELVKANLPFKTSRVSSSVALQMVDDPHGDRKQLLHGWVNDRPVVVTVGEYNDLAYGPFVPSTRFLPPIKIVGLDEGLLLALEPVKVPEKSFKDFMLNSARQAKEWNRRMNVDTVGKLNELIVSGKGPDLIQISETMHELYIGDIAKEIINRPDVRVVFISGPSSSGKTSTVRRLSTHLSTLGKETIYIGLDDYYLAAVNCPKDENGEYDFEALEALNVERIKSDLRSLIEGKPTSIPHYDFVRQAPCSKEKETTMQLRDDQILLIEGIHGLNPVITNSVPKERAFSVFVSALPQLSLDHVNRVPTTYARLLRRIIRDRRYRGISAESTILRWPSVRRGENKHIFPYQHLADAMFNSALAYELAIFRSYGWLYLMEVKEDSPAYLMARDMLRFLSLVVPMDNEWIPKNSVLREFVGGSIYKY
ncbi:hypothetical protein IJT10_08830 [bacterium]|nr:hypothetical protein [bacterium]